MIADFLSLATTLTSFTLIIAAVLKMYQIGGDLRDIKQMMAQNQLAKNGTHADPIPARMPAAVTGSAPGEASGATISPEELVRAVHAQSFKGEDFPV